jgi:hypothetical protein
MNQDVIDLRRHASCNYMVDDKRRAEMTERISHSGGLTAT